MTATDDATNRLLQELSEAKAWPDTILRKRRAGEEVESRIREAEEKVADLEKRAKEAMKRLGCVSPETRRVYNGMADMLIAWQTFKDSLIA